MGQDPLGGGARSRRARGSVHGIAPLVPESAGRDGVASIRVRGGLGGTTVQRRDGVERPVPQQAGAGGTSITTKAWTLCMLECSFPASSETFCP